MYQDLKDRHFSDAITYILDDMLKTFDKKIEDCDELEKPYKNMANYFYEGGHIIHLRKTIIECKALIEEYKKTLEC